MLYQLLVNYFIVGLGPGGLNIWDSLMKDMVPLGVSRFESQNWVLSWIFPKKLFSWPSPNGATNGFLEWQWRQWWQIPSREFTYPTWGKGKSSSKVPWDRIPVSSQECNPLTSPYFWVGKVRLVHTALGFWKSPGVLALWMGKLMSLDGSIPLTLLLGPRKRKDLWDSCKKVLVPWKLTYHMFLKCPFQTVSFLRTFVHFLGVYCIF